MYPNHGNVHVAQVTIPLVDVAMYYSIDLSIPMPMIKKNVIENFYTKKTLDFWLRDFQTINLST